jgi:hypothetical protein
MPIFGLGLNSVESSEISSAIKLSVIWKEILTRHCSPDFVYHPEF